MVSATADRPPSPVTRQLPEPCPYRSSISGLPHLALGAGNAAKGPTLNAQVVADGIGHRQIASLKLGSESFERSEQPGPCHVDHARRTKRRTTRNGHRGSRAVDLMEQRHQGVTAER